MYYMFYTAWSVSGDIRLSLATTPDPTSAPRCMCVLLGAALLPAHCCLIRQASSWTRHGTVFEGPHKSAALLIRDAPPHYLFYGAGEIRVSRSSDMLRWQPGEPFLRGTAWGNPNVEAGPPPLRLADGNYVLFFNSWKAAGSAYQPAWAVLDGDDPTRVLASASPSPVGSKTAPRWRARGSGSRSRWAPSVSVCAVSPRAWRRGARG